MSVSLMTVIAILFFAFGHNAIDVFVDDPEVIAIGASAVKILALSLPITGFTLC